MLALKTFPTTFTTLGSCLPFFLSFQGLLDVTCKTVANMIKGKTPEDIRKTFNIKNDFTPSEEEQVRKENEWCEEK